MRVTTIVYCITLFTRAKRFIPNAVHLPPNVVTTSSKHTSQYQSNRDHALHAWSPFQKETPSVPDVVVPTILEPGPLDTKNAIALAVWVTLIGWAFLLAPGSLGAPADNELITTLISQPYPRPESVNEIWFTIWNLFVVVPGALAALAAPNGRGQRLPAAPFLSASAGLGYFALGPYFATRTVRTEYTTTKGELGWASRNIFENRAFGIFLTAITLSLPFTGGLLAPDFDFAAASAGFVELASGSRFVAVAGVDIAIMSVVAAVLVGEDAKCRGWEDKSTLLTVGSILFPALGPCLYLAARPSLEE